MQRNFRAAMTLVEMLVAMAVTLIMMGAVVTLFGNVGSSISDSRAVMEISERLRNARNVLQTDLQNVTATMLPPRRPENDEGYFEYIEGEQSDRDPIKPDTVTGAPAWVTLLGDSDDLLRMTVRSRAEPFVGQANGVTITSQTAEIIWFTKETSDAPVLDVTALHTTAAPTPVALQGQPRRVKTLYRRVLLVAPSINPVPPPGGDVSVSSFSGSAKANTLGDLTKRENRFASDTTFPFAANLASITPVANDIILTNVLAFDIKAYDPDVPVGTAASSVAVLPSDPGYTAPSSPYPTGGFVDLNFTSYLGSSSIVSQFSHGGSPQYLAQNAAMKLPLPTYDTWSLHYNTALGNLGGTNFTGFGSDGLDNDGNGVVDDLVEQQAPPPYSVSLRGIQVRIRVYEPDSRQVREVTVVQDFLPQ